MTAEPRLVNDVDAVGVTAWFAVGIIVAVDPINPFTVVFEASARQDAPFKFVSDQVLFAAEPYIGVDPLVTVQL